MLRRLVTMLNRALSLLKYHLFSSVSQKFYWTLMGKFQAVRAVTSQYTDLRDSLESGAEIVAMLDELNALGANVTALQIGCGIGRIELHLYKKVRLCYGIDISPSMIEKATENVPAANVSFICSDNLAAVPVKDLNLIYSIFVFQHLPRTETRRYIEQSYAKLAFGGRLIFQVLVDETGAMADPRENHPYGLRYYRREDLRRMLRAVGFTKIQLLSFPAAGPDLGVTGDLLVVAFKV